ncbi:MAG: hypothetical protein V2B19_03430, partial [Pseudomonadota bacterium]
LKVSMALPRRRRSIFPIGASNSRGTAAGEAAFGLDHRFGQFPAAGRPRQGVFGRAAGCLSDSEFLPVWKKYPGVAEKTIKAQLSLRPLY